MLLYQVEGFYVEVYYNTKERTIKRYLCFECTDLLDPYINNIDLSPVYKYLNKKAKNREVHLVSFGDNETDKLFSKKGTSRKFNQNRTITNFMSGIFNALFSKTSKKQH
jgi:hypothetical protein